MHKRITFLVFIIFALILSSCVKEKKIEISGEKGATIVIGVPEEPSKLNPLYPPLSGENYIVNNLFLPLHEIGPDGDIVPVLASSWEYGEDMKSITYYLKKNLKWSDGKPITADDIVFTFNAMKDPKNAYPNLSQIQYIKNVEKINDYTVRFYFSIVYSDELFDSNIRPLPAHLFKNTAEVKNSKYNFEPVVNGPFKLSKWQKGNYIELTQNSEFKLYNPNPRNIVFVFYKGYDQAVEMLKKGIYDIAIGLPPKYYITVKDNPLLSTKKELGNSYTFIGWNLEKPLFSEKETRRALTMSINRKMIIDSLLNGLGDIAAGPIPPSSWAYDKNLKPLPYSVQKAVSLLNQKGWKKRRNSRWLTKNGKKFQFELLVNKENSFRITLANMIKNQLAAAGIKVTVKVVDGNTFITRLLMKNYDAFIMAWNVSEKLNMLPIWSSDPQIGKYNLVGYKNPNIDNYIRKATETLIETEAKHYWDLFQEQISADQPYTFLFVGNKITIANKRIKGLDIFNKQRDALSNLAYIWIPSSMRVKFDIASIMPQQQTKSQQNINESKVTASQNASASKTKKEVIANPEQILEAAAKKTTTKKTTTEKKDTSENAEMAKKDTTKAKEAEKVIIVQPRLKKLVQPEYPEAAKAIGAEGMIFVQVTIDVNGNVKNARIIRGFNNDACNKAAIRAAMKSKWYPGTRNGKPVEMKQTIPYRFTAE